MPAREVKIWNADTSTWEFLGLAEPPDATLTFGTALPQALGTASAGTATVPSRADHVHVMPSAADVGAVGTATTITAGTALSGGGDLSTSRTLNVVLSDATPLAVGTPAAGTATSPARADHVHEGTTLSSATPAALGTAAAGTATTAARGDHVHSTDGLVLNSLVNAKGDLVTATADNTPAVQSVGANGEVLYADSSATNGLRWQPAYNAGRNRIINGGFDVWQLGTSRTVADSEYGPDRLRRSANGTGTFTFSRQAFTPGTIAGYEPTYFCRYQITSPASATYNTIQHPIEDVRTFAGQPMTFSVWMKVASGTLSVTPQFHQFFGAGGSSDVVVNGSAWTVTTDWQRFTVTFAGQSISGKTIGTSHWVAVDLALPVNTALTLDLWGMQAEAGNVATRFEEEPYEATLRKCQRYYYRHTPGAAGPILGTGWNSSTTKQQVWTPFPVAMRSAPTALEQNGTASHYKVAHAATTTNLSAVATFVSASTMGAQTEATVASGLTAGQGSALQSNDATAYLAWSAEL